MLSPLRWRVVTAGADSLLLTLTGLFGCDNIYRQPWETRVENRMKETNMAKLQKRDMADNKPDNEKERGARVARWNKQIERLDGKIRTPGINSALNSATNDGEQHTSFSRMAHDFFKKAANISTNDRHQSGDEAEMSSIEAHPPTRVR